MDEAITKISEISGTLNGISGSVDTIWVLITAGLVFFMQAGFAMVEAGFTRSKNTANILMKNLMDFSFGSLAFWIIGFGIMFGDDIAGFIGKPNLFFTSDAINGIPEYASLIFQTVFAATAATIVSGAMAERTKFSAYIIYSIAISLVIYPISGHWVWGGGWLSSLGFHDFAGSTVVHSVGGWIGLAGAIMLGPRVGKYTKGKANAIPGHNLSYGTLGVFILWFGWFGFNPGSQLAASGPDNAVAISKIFVTTNLAAAAGAVSAMCLAWLRYKRPSLSLSLNGALAGLVAITAPCAVVSPTGAVIIGLLAGIILVFSVEFIDQVLKIDDPVGAVSVHGVNGAFGTLAVGLFSTSDAVGKGLFYGGGFKQLGIQATGVVAVGLWAFLLGLLLFGIIKALHGLRVEKVIEEEGLDVYEHGESAYNM